MDDFLPKSKNVKFFAEKDLKNDFISAIGIKLIRPGSYKGESLWGFF